MITQELIAYVKSELNKGKTKEEVRSSLLSGGGWSESDVAEVFQSVMPKDDTAINIAGATVAKTEPALVSPAGPRVFNPNITPQTNPTPTPPAFSSLTSSYTPKTFVRPQVQTKTPFVFPWKMVIFALIFGSLCFSGWYYRSSLISLPGKVTSIVNSFFEKKENPIIPPSAPLPPVAVAPTPIPPIVEEPVDCGITNAIDRKNTNSYLNDVTLKCLGENALSCKNAYAVINDSFFPTLFKITNKNNTCQFNLAYSEDSTLVDVKGKSVAGRSIFCPISIVKSIDESNPKSTVFKSPNMENPSIYAKDIYFYGTLGLFIENNFSSTKIENLGCSGSFVSSVIESYLLNKPK